MDNARMVVQVYFTLQVYVSEWYLSKSEQILASSQAKLYYNHRVGQQKHDNSSLRSVKLCDREKM
jgi:hypothetical protein